MAAVAVLLSHTRSWPEAGVISSRNTNLAERGQSTQPTLPYATGPSWGGGQEQPRPCLATAALPLSAYAVCSIQMSRCPNLTAGTSADAMRGDGPILAFSPDLIWRICRCPMRLQLPGAAAATPLDLNPPAALCVRQWSYP